MISIYAPMVTSTLAVICAVFLIATGDFAGAGAWLIFSTIMMLVARFEAFLQQAVKIRAEVQGQEEG